MLLDFFFVFLLSSETKKTLCPLASYQGNWRIFINWGFLSHPVQSRWWSYLHIILAIFEIMCCVRFILFEGNIISRNEEVCHFLSYFFQTLMWMWVEWTLIIFKVSVTWQLLWSPLPLGPPVYFLSLNQFQRSVLKWLWSSDRIFKNTHIKRRLNQGKELRSGLWSYIESNNRKKDCGENIFHQPLLRNVE